MENAALNQIIQLAKALSDESRLRAVMALHHQGELCACQLIELLDLAAPTVSRHMSLLTQAGLVTSRKQGRWVYYALTDRRDDPAVTEALNWALRALATHPQTEQDRETLCRITSCSPEDLCRQQRS